MTSKPEFQRRKVKSTRDSENRTASLNLIAKIYRKGFCEVVRIVSEFTGLEPEFLASELSALIIEEQMKKEGTIWTQKQIHKN